MFTAILFTIVFFWLFILSVRQANVTHWFRILQDERDKVLAFIEEAKAKRYQNEG